MARWTPKVTARAQLAELLQKHHAERAKSVGLLVSELEAISEHGRRAEKADNLQKEQLAHDAAQRGMRKDLREDVYAREEALRDRLRAILGELLSSSCDEERKLGVWLSYLSFARYRFREVAKFTKKEKADDDLPIEGEVRAVMVRRVLRADMMTRTRGLAAFCETLVSPGREIIVKRLEARGMAREELVALAADARKLASMGPNVKRPVKATPIEAEAVRAQQLLWQRVRKMLQKAVRGVPELERKWNSC